MEEFIVSARKYRPQTFDDVVGQLHITGTLKNAIRSNKIAHAFLFCGPRGVGKTTCARIMAKTLNCLNLKEDIEPCNKCESCVGFNSSHSFNIHELDAASNNSVDDIRNLIEQVRIAPQVGKYSIYIIDEVHMLSSAAFNAFLKTLEEPPAHAIFILATTEKHKILPTILSRCQVFDFHRITIDDIANHLGRISVKEDIDAEPDALHVVAQKADGALRDALSIFDRIVTFAGTRITYKDVIDNLNILDYDYYFKVTDHALAGNYKELLLLYNDILANGFDGQQFLSGLADHFRNLMVAQDAITLKLLETGESTREKYMLQSKKSDARYLFDCLKVINDADTQYKTSNNKRLLVEIALLQLAELKKKSDRAAIAAVPQPEAKAPEAHAATENPPEALKAEETVPVSSEPAKPQAPPVALPKKTISIRNTVQKEEKNETENEEEKLRNSYTAEALEAAWQTYADRQKAMGKNSFYTTLTRHKPQQREDTIVEFVLDHSAQQREMDEYKQEIVQHLRAVLGNGFIQVHTVIRQGEGEKIPLSSHEKFEEMVKKNPNVQKLREQFNLDLGL